MGDEEIREGINRYINARRELLELGRRHPKRFGGNDNMIGRIGEFIALRFLEQQLGQRPTKPQSVATPGYDLIDAGNRRTQVKVLTCEAGWGRSVRLGNGWEQFLLIDLAADYRPQRIGLLTHDQHSEAVRNHHCGDTPTVSLTMLKPSGLIGRYGRVWPRSTLPTLI